METVTQDAIATGIELLTSWGLQVIGAIVVLILGRIAAGMLRRGARRALERSSADPSLVPFLSGIVYYTALAVVGIVVLGLFGIETTSLIAVLGAAGLAVGLALQGTLSNFASGVMLLVFRPFRVGDYVVAAGSGGTVKEIGLFTTELATPDNVQVIVPNSDVFSGTITNYSAHDTRRNDLEVGIAYGDDIGRAIEAVERVLVAEDRVLDDPEPVVAVGALGDSSVNLLVRPWCRASDYWPLRFDLTRRLKEEIEAAGCTIPFPQRDVHVVREQGSGEAA